jgi:hypothetical protein
LLLSLCFIEYEIISPGCVFLLRAGESWSMDKLDSNPARIHGPLGATYSYGRKQLSFGSEIAAAPTADGGVLTFIRDQQHSTMWTGRADAGGGSWAPLCRAPFPMFATADSMVRTSSGVLVMAGQFPIVSLEVSWDDGATSMPPDSAQPILCRGSCRVGPSLSVSAAVRRTHMDLL